MATFSPDVVGAVLSHMNDDHHDDNVVIVRAFAGVEPDVAVMTDLDEHGGVWGYTIGDDEHELRIPWSKELTERPEIRREVVEVYGAACVKLGIEPHAH
jgi:hypothetical protein